MNGTMVRQMMPEFEMEAYDAKTGHCKTVSSADYKDKWAVVCFNPADFTFVCPTEITAMNALPVQTDMEQMTARWAIGHSRRNISGASAFIHLPYFCMVPNL